MDRLRVLSGKDSPVTACDNGAETAAAQQPHTLPSIHATHDALPIPDDFDAVANATPRVAVADIRESEYAPLHQVDSISSSVPVASINPVQRHDLPTYIPQTTNSNPFLSAAMGTPYYSYAAYPYVYQNLYQNQYMMPPAVMNYYHPWSHDSVTWQQFYPLNLSNSADTNNNYMTPQLSAASNVPLDLAAKPNDTDDTPVSFGSMVVRPSNVTSGVPADVLQTSGKPFSVSSPPLLRDISPIASFAMRDILSSAPSLDSPEITYKSHHTSRFIPSVADYEQCAPAGVDNSRSDAASSSSEFVWWWTL